jgi:hypothetical protein
MANVERQQTILDILQNLDGLDGLKRLFWQELNFERQNKPLSPRQWPESARQALAEDPILFASGGEDNAFHVVYCRLISETLARGLERPVVNRLIKEHPYALFVFSNKAQSHWHFLNVKYDEAIEKRRLIRRITIGPGERLRTASQRVQLLDLQGIGPELFALPPMTIQDRCDEAFDVEAVTKEFFQKFAELYHRVADDVAEVCGLEVEAGTLAQLMLDRMIFLYFIQKKGWLNEQPDYLYEKFLECWRKDPAGSTFYSSVLYPLFLCLSDATQSFERLGSVPFLNGGLFEESTQQAQGERIAQTRLQIKNRTFKAVFDELLEHFNFTVTEDTPLDVEVAIDPEMLGKIFESLILQLEKDPGKDLRSLTGSYYTPRVIVHFMCQESLKEYLVDHVERTAQDGREAVSEKVHRLLELPPADQLDEEQVDDLNHLFSVSQAKVLRQAILDCRVCDPAVGSGAFPVGMLHEMTATVARLDVRLHGKAFVYRRNYDYDLKKEVVECCLYGVDIQEQAVRLCELRLWLSLVVDYQFDRAKPFASAIREVPSLPNLSYRIMRGDSLLERIFGHVVELDQMAKDPSSKQLIESVQADKEAYFRESRTLEKRRLEAKILVKQLDLAQRLLDAKAKALEEQAYQPSIFGDEEMAASDKVAKLALHGARAEIQKLRQNLKSAQQRADQLTRQKHPIARGDLDTLRRQYFRTGDIPSFIWRVDFAEVFSSRNGFDIIVGNPPYLFGENIAANDEHYRQHYQTAKGQYDTYWLFIERDCRLMQEGGIHCFIHSDAFLARDETTKLREWLFARWQDVTLSHVGTVFPGVGVSAVVIKFRLRQPATTNIEIVAYDPERLAFVDRRIVAIPAATKDAKRRIATVTAGVEWLDRLLAARYRFGDFFTISRGEELGKSSLSRSTGARLPPGMIPILAGEGVDRLSTPTPRHYIQNDTVAKPMRNYRSPKVVLVKTGSTFNATVDEEGLVTLQSVYNIHPTSDMNAYVGAGLLISLPFNALLAARVTNQKKLFPQITQGNVAEMPVPALTKDQQERIERLVKSAMHKKMDVARAQRDIDHILFDAFGFSPQEVRGIVAQQGGNTAAGGCVDANA